MTTILAEHQFEILPSAEADSGFVFGIGADVSVNEDGFNPGENEWITQDGQNTRRGTTAFGRDVLAGKTWSWESHTNRENITQAAETLDAFSAMWAPELLALEPGEVTSLRYQMAGRSRRIFGRPRRYAAPPTNLILNGMVPISHEFKCVDAYTYTDAESSASIGYSSSATGGGFSFPVTFPVLTQSSDGAGDAQITVGGNARTYPVIRFNGPWINPGFTTDNWALVWTGEISANGWIEIDCRPWGLTVLNQSGASAVAGLERRTYLEDCWFAPNSQPQISLSGASASGSASAFVRWRDAWTSI